MEQQMPKNIEYLHREIAALEELRQKLTERKRIEMEKRVKDASYDPHFDEFEPADLSLKDLTLYQKLEEGTLTAADLKARQNELLLAAQGSEQYRSAIFAAWLINQWQIRQHAEKPETPKDEKHQENRSK